MSYDCLMTYNTFVIKQWLNHFDIRIIKENYSIQIKDFFCVHYCAFVNDVRPRFQKKN